MVLVYIIIGLIINKVTRSYANKYLRQGHLMLALICRAENNRIYLSFNVEMRPGYLGKWIEFHTYEPTLSFEDILDHIHERW